MSEALDADAMIEQILENAAWLLDGDEDAYYALCLKLDPDGRIDAAALAHEEAADEARRAALSPEARAAEDAHFRQLVERGMAIVREIMGRARAAAPLEPADPAP